MNDALFHGDFVNSKRIIYTPSGFAKLSLLHIQEIGELKAQKPHMSKREHLNSYLFFIVLSGSGTLSYEGSVHTLTAGSCVFIDCKKPYFHETSEDLWKLQWIHFNGPAMTNIYEKYIERGGLPAFHSDHIDDYISEWENLYKIASGEDYVRDMKINEGLSAILTKLMEDSWHPDNSRRNTKKTNLLDIKNYLDQNYTKKITLDELSERYFINKFYLTRIFKEQFGVSINTYLLQVRITKAKQLLRFTDKTAEQIGLDTGLGALYYFSRTFKKVEGISPSEFRRQWRS